MTMMRPQFATTTSLRLLLFALYVSGTSAVVCDFPKENTYNDNSVSNQAELDTLTVGCTEINGNINIAANYTGRFYLNNVATINGGIKTPTVDHGETYTFPEERIPVPLLTSIQAPYLTSSWSIDLNGVPALTYIWFPSLTEAGSIDLIEIGEGCIVDFPALTSTNSLLISGNSTDMSFPLLVDGGNMEISGGPIREFDEIQIWNFDHVDRPPFDISFPELQKGSSIFLQGNIRSLEMPQLSTVGDENNEYYRHLRIRTYGDPLDISLPNLSDPGEIAVAGTIGSISLHSLISLKIFDVNTSTPLNVTLEPIQTISDKLKLVGSITEVSMSSITELNTIYIRSDYGGFHCSSIDSEVERITGSKLDDDQCRGRVKSKLPLILGLSIGLGSPVLFAFLGYLCWRRRRRQKMEKKAFDKPPGYELGVPPTYNADGLPTYVASEGERGSEQGAADVAGARTGDARSVRGEGASEQGAADVAGACTGDAWSVRGEGASAHSAVDAASARLGDGSSAHPEEAAGRRVV